MNSSGEKHTLIGITIPTLRPRDPTPNPTSLSSACWFFFDHDKEKRECHCRIEGCSIVIGNIVTSGGATGRLYRHLRSKHSIDRVAADELVAHFQDESTSGTQSTDFDSFKRAKVTSRSIPPQQKIYEIVMNMIGKCNCSSNLIATKEFKELIRYLLSSPLDKVKTKSGEKRALDNTVMPTLRPRYTTMNIDHLSSSCWFFFNHDKESRECHCRIEDCTSVISKIDTAGGATGRLYRHLQSKHDIDRVVAGELVSRFRSGNQLTIVDSSKRVKVPTPSITPQQKIYRLVMSMISKCKCSLNLADTKEFKELTRFLLSSSPSNNVKNKNKQYKSEETSAEKHTLGNIIIPTLRPKDSTMSTAKLSSSCWFFYNYDKAKRECYCRIEDCTFVLDKLDSAGGATDRLYRHLRVNHNIDKETANKLVSHFQNESSEEFDSSELQLGIPRALGLQDFV